MSTTADGKTYRNAYTYENDRLKTVSHNTTSDTANDVTYTFDYDDMGNQTTVKVGSQTFSTNVYTATDRSRNLQRVDYGNGGKVHYSYDAFDRITGMKYDAEAANRYTYEYGANSEVARVTDTSLGHATTTEYDLANRPRQTSTRSTSNNTLIYQTTLNYDKYDNLSLFRERVGTEAHQTTYAYDRDNRTTAIEYGASTRKVAYTYDGLGRITKKAVTNGSGAVDSTYAFVAGGQGTSSTTLMVASITQPNQNLAYAYDDVGNITSETRAGKATTYAYDNIGQLIRVNDPNDMTGGSTGTTWTYEYDRGGNILNKKRYAYTTGTLGAVQQTITYTYDATWKDKLASYNGQALTHDAIGNLKTDGTWTYNWAAGRQLTSMTSSARR